MTNSNPYGAVQQNPMLSQKQSLTLPCTIVKGSSKELRKRLQGYWRTNSEEKPND